MSIPEAKTLETGRQGRDKQAIDEKPLRNFTLQQLARTPQAVAVNGTVWDVSSLPIYRPGGRYAHLVGHDASYAIATSAKHVTVAEDNRELSALTTRQRMTLQAWAEMLYTQGCPVLGKLVTAAAPQLDMSLADCSRRTGQEQYDTNAYAVAPMYLACNRVVFDVSFGGQDLYGPGAPYNCLVGKDASRVLARMSMTPADINGTLNYSALTDQEKKNLAEWEAKLRVKGYPIVGYTGGRVP